MTRSRLVALALLAGACGGSAALTVVDVREVSEPGGAPTLRGVRDLGAAELPDTGALSASDSDGRFVIGELVLVEGDDLGKQPTLAIGGRPAEILRRTGAGGIVTRIPGGLRGGPAEVTVTTSRGKDQKSIAVTRLGVVAGPATLSAVALPPGPGDALPNAETVALPSAARGLALSADGSAAYVAAGDGITVVALSSRGGPRALTPLPLEGGATIAVATADNQPLLAALGPSALTLLGTKDPIHPARWSPWTLPQELVAGGPAKLALDPAGQTVAVLLRQTNEVAFVDVADPTKPALRGKVAVLDNERLPLVRDLRFAADGRSLWVLVGASAASAQAGDQPTRVVVLALSDKGEATRAADVTLPGVGAPVALDLARARDFTTSAAVAVPLEDVAAHIAAADPALLAGTSTTPKGHLVRAGTQGLTGAPRDLDGVPAAIASVPDGSAALIALATAGPGGVELAALFLGPGGAAVRGLGTVDPALARAPFTFAHAAVQP